MRNAEKSPGTCVRPSPPGKCWKCKAQTEPDMEPKVKAWKELPPQCSMCSNAAPLSCARCKCSFYCSLECQNADWQTHKVICKQWLNFETSGLAMPPDPSSRRGIFFPAGTDIPQFVWVTTDWIPAKDKNTPGCEHIDFQPFFGDEVVYYVPITGNAIRSRRRDHDRMQLFLRPNAIYDESSRNSTVSRITCGNTIFYPWCGSLLAMKCRSTFEFGPEIRYTHMDTSDFRDLVDLLCSYNSGLDMNNMGLNLNHKGPESHMARTLQAIGASQGDDPPENPANKLYSLMNSPKSNIECVPGVRINCLRDMYARGKDMYEAVDVPISDPIWDERVEPTIVSQLVDYPIRTRRIRPISDNDDENLPATFLHMYPNLLRNHWGQALPLQWQRRAGSVLVVYADYEEDEAEPANVKVLCSFCMDFLKPCMEIYMEDPEDMQLREEIIRTVVNPEVYRRFCNEYECSGVFRGASDWPKGDTSSAQPPTMTDTTLFFRKQFTRARRARVRFG